MSKIYCIGLVWPLWPALICNAVLVDDSANDSFSELHNGGTHQQLLIISAWNPPQLKTSSPRDMSIVNWPWTSKLYYSISMLGNGIVLWLICKRDQSGNQTTCHKLHAHHWFSSFYFSLSIPLHPYFLDIVHPWLGGADSKLLRCA